MAVSMTPSALPGFVNLDGMDVCVSLSTTRSCSAWVPPTSSSANPPFLSLSALARTGGISTTAEPLVYDVDSFDKWVNMTSTISAVDGAKGYISGLLRAGGCQDLKVSASQIPLLRYPKSFICAQAVLIDSTPVSKATLKWNATSNTGGGPALSKICLNMNAVSATDSTCIQGVQDEVDTCGFGSQHLGEAVQHCLRNRSDPCCTSITIPPGTTLQPTSPQQPPTTPTPSDTSKDTSASTASSKTALVLGLISASLGLLIAAIAVATFVARRYGSSVRDFFSKCTFGLIAPSDDASVYEYGGPGTRNRIRKRRDLPAIPNSTISPPEGLLMGTTSASSSNPHTNAHMVAALASRTSFGGTSRPNIPTAVWNASGTLEREGLVSHDSTSMHNTTGSRSSRDGTRTPGYVSMTRQGTTGSRSSMWSLGRKQQQESLGRASTKSGTGTLVLRKGESFGPETFRTRWRGVTPYLPRLPDEVEIQPDDYVTLSTFYNDGWAFGRNERTQMDGYLPLSCVVATGDETLTRPSFMQSSSTNGEPRSAGGGGGATGYGQGGYPVYHA
ncbi:hypothetical protein HDU97_004738 [Phlyctochytrium planicorne]|nr:hypothetical protein HDU97_004738 [Phlyctochytrium planicorne]